MTQVDEQAVARFFGDVDLATVPVAKLRRAMAMFDTLLARGERASDPLTKEFVSLETMQAARTQLAQIIGERQ